MNFLKRAGAILMVVAIFASSCNKYADDFKQLNTKLDGLAATVGSITTISADVTALKGQIAGVLTAIAAIPNPTAAIATLTANVKLIDDKVVALGTSVAAIKLTGETSAGIIAGLKTDLAAAKKAIDDNNTAMNLKLKELADTDVLQSAELKKIVDANVVLLEKIEANKTALDDITSKLANAQTSLDGLTAAQLEQATKTSIDALKVLIDAQGEQLKQILLNQVVPVTGVTVAVTTAGDAVQDGIELTATIAPVGSKASYVWNTATSGSATAALTPIAGAEGTTVFTLTSAEVGKYIVVVATGKDNNLSTAKRSAATAVVVVKTPITLLTLGGTGANVTAAGAIVVDSTLTAIVAPTPATVDYLWESAPVVSGPWTALSGTAKTHKIVAADYDKYLRVSATGKGGYTGSLTSAATASKVVSSSSITSAQFGFVAGQNTLTITVAGAIFKDKVFSKADFIFTGADGTKFKGLAALQTPVLFTRVDANNIRVQLTSSLTFDIGNLNTIQFVQGSLTGLATSVTVTPGTLIALGIPVGTAITGVTAPVTGASQITTGTLANAVVTVAWSPAAATFAAGTVYTATVTVTPTAGTYTLAGIDKDKFTLDGVTGTTSPVALTTVNVIKVYPITSAAPLTVISNSNLLPYLPLPVAGASMPSTLTDSQFTGTVTWARNWVGANLTGSFTPGTIYTATVTLTPVAGYTLVGTLTNFYTVAGATATNGSGSNTVTVVYPVSNTLAVASQTIAGISRPTSGASHTANILTAPTGVGFTSTIVSWTDTTTPLVANWAVGDVAVATYTLIANTGYTFSGAAVFGPATTTYVAGGATATVTTTFPAF